MKLQEKNPAREKALAKVRKMFALANDNGASEGEIENALKMAQILMSKFNIEQGEVDLSPDDIDIEEQENERLQCERKYWMWDLLTVIGEAYDCNVIRSKRFDKTFYKIIGTNQDRILVKELFLMTVPMIRNLYAQRYLERKKYLKENPLEAALTPLPVRHFFIASYVEGFIDGLKIKMRKTKEDIKKEDETGNFALMVVKKDELIKNFVTANFKKLKSAKSTSSNSIDGAAYGSGLKDGQENTNKRLM